MSKLHKAVVKQLEKLVREIRSDAENLSPTHEVYPVNVMLNWSRRLERIAKLLKED